MNPVKKIWFDENSTPPKNMIWYRGEGKFYEWKNNDWVLCYNLVDVATQEQLERNNYIIAQALNDLNERIGGLQSQIANQDYNKIISNSFSLQNNADFLSKLAANFERGTIYDVVCVYNTQDGNKQTFRIISTTIDTEYTKLMYWDDNNGELMAITLYYNSKQYSSLAVIQDKINSPFEIPGLGQNDDFLYTKAESEETQYLVCVDDKKVSVIFADDDSIESLQITDIPATGDYINVTEDELNNLIGIVASF